MATKNKEAKACPLDNSPEIQKAISAIRRAQEELKGGFGVSGRAAGCIYEAQEELSQAESCLRGVLKRTNPTAKTDGGLPSQKGPGKVSAGRKHMASRVPTSPRRNRKASKVGVGARVQPEPSGKEFFHGQQLPH